MLRVNPAPERIEYLLKGKRLLDDSGQATKEYLAALTATRAMLEATGRDRLSDQIRSSARRGVIDLPATLRSEGVKATPFDKLLPWVYREALKDSSATNSELLKRAAAIMQWQAATRTDINKLTAEQVFAELDSWEQSAIAATRAKNVYEFSDGWTVQKLTTKKELEQEGKIMRHCVGGYCEQVASGKSEIYSLRDSGNVPRITMEWSPEKKRFVQIHGPENEPPTPDVQPYLIEFITQVFDGETVGLLMTGVPAKDLDLSGANLSGANLTSADLSDADLSGADLSGADLSGANLTGANLSGANLTSAYLTSAYLTRAYLRDANLTRAYLIDANLTRAYLTEADLYGADLSEANLTGSDLSEADLYGADLSDANLTEADLHGANLIDAKLTRAYLTRANLRGANLGGANMRDANLIDAKLLAANLRGVKLNEANLTGSDLSGASLISADLTDANLTNANLTNATLSRAILYGADLTGADLTDTIMLGARRDQ